MKKDCDMVRKLSVLLFTLLSFGLAWGQKYVYRVTGGDNTTLDYYYWENIEGRQRIGDSIQILIQDEAGNAVSAKLELHGRDTLECNIMGEATISFSEYEKYSLFTCSSGAEQIKGGLEELFEFNPITHEQISYRIKKFVIVLRNKSSNQQPISDIYGTYYNIRSRKPLTSSEIEAAIQAFKDFRTPPKGIKIEPYIEI